MSNLFSGPRRGSVGSVGGQDDEQRGIDRRTLIKRAAATGAVAWTAPVVIQSLTSPAGALTCGGCFLFQIAANFLCFEVTQTEGVTTISPCGTLSAGCTTTTNVPPGAQVDDFAGGVCTDLPGDQLDCQSANVRFAVDIVGFCTWGGGGTCNAPRRFLAAQANTLNPTACVAGSINANGSRVTFTLTNPGQEWQHFQFIVGCSCA
jgi:hypothetical protein